MTGVLAPVILKRREKNDITKIVDYPKRIYIARVNITKAVAVSADGTNFLSFIMNSFVKGFSFHSLNIHSRIHNVKYIVSMQLIEIIYEQKNMF